MEQEAKEVTIETMAARMRDLGTFPEHVIRDLVGVSSDDDEKGDVQEEEAVTVEA
jgi:hypothetical protein